MKRIILIFLVFIITNAVAQYKIEGQVKYDNNKNTPIQFTTINLKDASNYIIATTTTDITGYYSFNEILNGTYTIELIIKYKWGGGSPTDALIINKFFSKLYDFKDELMKKAADVNKDENINSTDALYINKRFIKIINSFQADEWLLDNNSVTINGQDIIKNIKVICSGDVDGSYIPVYTFTNCNDYLIDTRDGQPYKTKLIGLQCWMSKNLNIGTTVIGNINQYNNNTIEKYCYNDLESNCNIYGGLYQWNEMMQYNTNEGVQGICPTNWHIPTDAEWFIFENFVDPTVDNPNIIGWRGTDGGTKLKEGGSSDFEVFLSGCRVSDGTFNYIGATGFFWSSSIYVSDATASWRRGLTSRYTTIERNLNSKTHGFSVRCIKNCISEPSVSFAGLDQININGTSTTLAANLPTSGSGQWTIISGIGGTITTPTSPTSIFSGIAGISYTLRWSISTSCTSSIDDVIISFCAPPTIAAAGIDQIDVSAKTTTLGGNTPISGTGQWSIVSGIGGIITTPSSPVSKFTGTVGINYSLRWTITTTNCGNSTDDVTISFCTSPTTSVAGADQLNISGTFVTLAGNTPTIGTGKWSIVNGTGGTIATPSSATSKFTGTAGTSYTLRWTISNSCASSTDDVIISFAATSFSCGINLVDTRDNKSYKTVIIGNQCWMAQNLNIGIRIDGDNEQYDNITIEKYCYNDAESNCNIYGGLYRWNEMMNYSTNGIPQGICPSGWHIPSDTEWTTLTTFLGGEGVAGGKMKEIGTTHWSSPNTGATNSSGFLGFAGGYYYYYSIHYLDIIDSGHWWTSTKNGDTEAWHRLLYFREAGVGRDSREKKIGYSVRCIKN